MVGSWLGHLGTLIAILVILGSCLKTLQVNAPTGNLQILLQLVTYYARFWFIWLLIWANVQLLYDNQTIYWLLMALSLLYLYMSWVEPNRLRVVRSRIRLTVPAFQSQGEDLMAASPSASIAVLSDLHIGMFSNEQQLTRLVHCVNNLKVDAVLILGDWLYHAGTDLNERLKPLAMLNKPCYTVLSESDNQLVTKHEQDDAKPPHQSLIDVIANLGIPLLPEQGLTIAGIKVIGVHDGITIDVPRLIGQHSHAGQPLIIVTHDIKQLEANPRTLSDAKDNTLVVAGQTHGGQVNIPIVTPLMVRALTGNKLAAGLRKPNAAKLAKPSDEGSDSSKNSSKRYQVWVNTGIGMTGLPFRFNCPPTIDVLTIMLKTANE